MANLIEELKRRKVFRVAAMYSVVAWVLIQVADTVFPALQMPDWTVAFVTILFILGFPIAVVLSWAYEITPDGIQTDHPNQVSGATTTHNSSKLIYAIFVLLLLAVGLQLADRIPFLDQGSDVLRSSAKDALITGNAAPETHLDIVTPAAALTANFALSPNGRQIVFVAPGDNGASRLWLRSLNNPDAQSLDGTEGASTPFWSPDGRTIGFIANNALKRLDLGGGDPQNLTPINFPSGGTWGINNTLLFSSEPTGPIMQMADTGGETTAVTTLEANQISHRSPSFLPDSRHFLFYATGLPDASGIYLGNLDGTASVRLTPADSAGVFHPDGWLLWIREDILIAQKLDLEQATLMGEPVTLAEGVANNDADSVSALSVASTGLIAHRRGSASLRQLTWFDRNGTLLSTMGEPDGTIFAPQQSPNGDRVVVYRTLQGNIDVWLMDGLRTSRFTFTPGMDLFPLWSPDGSQIVFHSGRAGAGGLYKKAGSGTGDVELIFSSDLLSYPSSWSADGRFLMYMISNPNTSTDFWAIPMAGDPEPFVVLETPFDERWATFSPQGRWFAYHSNESGRNEVYIRAFVDPDIDTAVTVEGLWQVSTDGGTFPHWSPDGQELYYLNPAGDLLVAPIVETDNSIEVRPPVLLFPTRIFGGGMDIHMGRQFDVTADGEFLINTVVDESATSAITLIQNWNPPAIQ